MYARRGSFRPRRECVGESGSQLARGTLVDRRQAVGDKAQCAPCLDLAAAGGIHVHDPAIARGEKDARREAVERLLERLAVQGAQIEQVRDLHRPAHVLGQQLQDPHLSVFIARLINRSTGVQITHAFAGAQCEQTDEIAVPERLQQLAIDAAIEELVIATSERDGDDPAHG